MKRLSLLGAAFVLAASLAGCANLFNQLGLIGEDGADGRRTATIVMYQWAASAPTAFPTGNSVYTWADGSFTAPAGAGSWTTLPGAPTAGYYLYSCRVVYSDTDGSETSVIPWPLSGLTASVIGVAGADGVAGSNGLDGTNGIDGINGTRTAILEMYQWADSAPSSFPSGNSTYTWSTGAFLAPDNPNGWSVSPGTWDSKKYLYVCRFAYSDTDTSASTSIAWPLSGLAASVIGVAGADGISGTNGTRTAILEMYQWADSAPSSFPSGSSTYTWSTGVFTAPGAANSWTLTPGEWNGRKYLYLCRFAYSDTGTTATTSIDWPLSGLTASVIGVAGTDGINGADGTSGSNGTRTAILEMYQWASSVPTSFPTGTSTYTWADGTFTTPSTTNAWSLVPGVPAPGDRLYSCRAVYSDSSTSATSEVAWPTSGQVASVIGVAGADGTSGSNGTRTAILEMYQWASSVPTSFPTGTSTYTWSSGTFDFSGASNGWTLAPGTPTAGFILYSCRAIYSDTGTSATSAVTWTGSGTAVAIGMAGTDGQDGQDAASPPAIYLVPVSYLVYDLAEGGGTIAAVGYFGQVATSTDAKTWTSRYTGTEYNLNSVAFGNGAFVAVGAGGTIIRSADAGASWSAATANPAGSTVDFASVSYGTLNGSGVFIAVGYDGELYGNVALASGDGDSWTDISANLSIASGNLTSVDILNGIAFVGASNGSLYTSTDGTNWILQESMNYCYNTILGVAYGGGQYLILDNCGEVMTSPDGAVWTPAAIFDTLSYYGDVCYGPSSFALLTQSGIIYLTTDPMTWSLLPMLSGFNYGAMIWVPTLGASGGFVVGGDRPM